MNSMVTSLYNIDTFRVGNLTVASASAKVLQAVGYAYSNLAFMCVMWCDTPYICMYGVCPFVPGLARSPSHPKQRKETQDRRPDA